MNFKHLSESSLKAYLKYYDILLTNNPENKEIQRFREDCLNELSVRDA